MSFKHSQIKISWQLTLVIILFGLVILGVSLAQASWATLNKDINMDRFRINPVEFEIKNSRGDGTETIKYNLPQISKVSGGFLYEVKKWRDNVWINISSRGDKRERANLYMLLADKKIAEMLVMSQGGDFENDDLFEFGQMAVSFLEKTVETTGEMDNVIEASKIKHKVKGAKFFYEQVFKSIGELVGETDRYSELNERLSRI